MLVGERACKASETEAPPRGWCSGGAFVCLCVRALDLAGKKSIWRAKRGNRSRAFDKSYYDRERRLRRWFGEVIIIFYQMPVLVEARGFGSASTPLVRGQSQMRFLRRPRT